jgi:hypothetical protein
MTTDKVVLAFTPFELEVLSEIVENGWADGEFADWQKSVYGGRASAAVAAAHRAMEKINKALAIITS